MKIFIVVVSVIGFLLLVLLAMRIVGEKVRFYKQLELDYPKEKYNGRARKTVKKKLKKFNFSFYRMYPGVNGDFKVIFTSYPKTHSDRFEYKKQIQMYELMNLEEQALEAIKKTLKVKMTIDDQISYFKGELQKSREAQDLINREMYKSFFPNLYRNRRGILLSVENNCLRIIENLDEERRIFEKAIQDLSRLKKPGFFGKVFRFTWNLATAPIRHVANIIGGIADDDPGRAGKSAGLLLLGLFGVGLAFEAIDGLEGLGSSGNLALDDSLLSDGGMHFVEPHSRLLADGTEIWVDGDGDPTVNLSVENGGGYLRGNPRG